MSNKEEYLTVTKAAELKECSRTTIYQLIRRGRINTYEVAGKQFVINDDAFLQTTVNRGVPFSRLERMIAVLEKRVEHLEKGISELKDKVACLEGRRRQTKVRTR